MTTIILPHKKYSVLYIDPPWMHYGDPNKNAAAGKHYDLMTIEDICALPIKDFLEKKAAVFLWATTPRLDLAMCAISEWELYYRGVAFIWIKTRKDGGIIHGQGICPTFTKPTAELVLVATTNKQGRPWPLLSMNTPQVVLHPRAQHSRKPAIIREHIVDMCGPELRKAELFARGPVPDGWDSWGKEAEKSSDA
jgi:N6-adenosine-specific RNA methylase IME4